MYDETAVHYKHDFYDMLEQGNPTHIEMFGVECIRQDPKFGVKYKGHHKNLTLVVGESGMRIKGSLHTFLERSNHTDFTYSQVKESIMMIDDFTNGIYTKSEICTLGIGVNLDSVDFDNFDRYRKAEFFPMIMKGKKYGLMAKQTNKHLKGYDKSYHVKREKQIITDCPKSRLELVLTTKQGVQTRGLKTPESLLSIDVFEQCGNLLYDHFKIVTMKTNIDYSRLSTKEKRALCTIKNRDPEFMNAVKNEKWFQKDRALANKLVIRDNQEVKGNLLNKIRVKVKELQEN